MKLKLGTFNLYQFVEPPFAWYNKKDKFNEQEWLEKTAWIKSQIGKMDCDIIGFQEVFSRKALKTLVKELGFDYFKVVDVAKLSKNDRFKYVTTTVALASKFPITNMQVVEAHQPSIQMHHFKETFKFSRVPIKATIELPNQQKLLVYVAHLKSNRLNEFEYVFKPQHTLEEKKEQVTKALEGQYSKALRQRLCEASSLFHDIEKYKNQPTVLLCDLNDKEFSITIDALSNPKYYTPDSEKEYLLYDASHEYEEEVYNPHPEAKVPVRKSTSYFLAKGNVLDYVFASKHFTKAYENHIAYVSNYAVLDEHLQNTKDGSLLTSDHAQVVCELTFR